jgi:predicted DNA-binding transcriptional regulator YafY
MPKTAEQKTRILTLHRILLSETDEAHPMTEERLRAALQANGIDAERKTVLDDLHALENFGANVEHRAGRGGGYFIEERTFESAELKLLVDAVQSSKFISEKKSRTLIDKLCTLTSRHEAGSLSRQVYVCGRVKTESAAALYAVDAIHSAIASNRRITFHYNEWTIEKTLRPRRGGALYEVSPYLLTWEDGNYYLVAYEDGQGSLKHFRVDKMTDVSVTDAHRGGEELFAHFDPALYSKETFGMYGGEETLVTLSCDDSLVGVVLDRFGDEVTLVREGEGRFRLTVRVRVSPVFLAWVIGYGSRMRILAPSEVNEALRALAQSALE